MWLRFACTFINSAYSFYWDVVKDWDLTLLSGSRRGADYPYGLRRHRCFSSDRLYYFAIIIDLVFRYSWLSKLVPGLVWLTERESGLFVLVFLEVARRWMWVFFRAEAEWGEFCFLPAPFLRSPFGCFSLLPAVLLLMRWGSTVRTHRGPAPDDIILGEISGKLDAD